MCDHSWVATRGWPEDWSERLAGKDCPICRSLGKGDNDFWVQVFEGEVAEVHLERRTRLPGYCIVVWRHGHVAEPTELSADAACGYWREVLAVGRAIESCYRPAKLNYFTLGNSVPHLHTHLVPRYLDDDPAPGGPIPWEAVFSDEPVDDVELHRQAAQLRHHLDR